MKPKLEEYIIEFTVSGGKWRVWQQVPSPHFDFKSEVRKLLRTMPADIAACKILDITNVNAVQFSRNGEGRVLYKSWP